MAEQKHGNAWKGGRVTDPRGYVLIHVGKEHPLADCRGYAYEHRLKAQARKRQDVHHENHVKSDNAQHNLKKASRRLHRVMHRQPGSRRRKPGQRNPIISCACGCGSRFRKFDNNHFFGRPRRYKHGHNNARNSRGQFIGG